jgi:Flp pilus assembly protein TadG
MAIVAPILLILLAGAIDLGRLFYSQVTIANAAREGALAAAQDPTKYEPNQYCVPPTHGPATNRVTCAAMFETRTSFITVQASDIAMHCDGTLIAIAADLSNCHAQMGHTVAVTVPPLPGYATALMWVSRMIDLSSTATGGSPARSGRPPLRRHSCHARRRTPTPTPTPTPRRSNLPP